MSDEPRLVPKGFVCTEEGFLDLQKSIAEFQTELSLKFAEAQAAIKERDLLVLLVDRFLLFHDSTVYPPSSEKNAIQDLRNAMRIMHTSAQIPDGAGETPTGKGVGR